MTYEKLSTTSKLVKQNKKIGIALGSGSARGLAHIGALHAIEESGIRIDLIAGSSIGALVGAIYAAGNLTALESSFNAFDWKKLVSLLDLVLPKSGLMNGRKVMDFVKDHLTFNDIEELPIPFQAVATDILSATEITIDKGNLLHAIRASIAVPGIFTPVYDTGHVLVDGGLVNPVPVSTARAMGADFVIAVDLNHEAPYKKNREAVYDKKETSPFLLRPVNEATSRNDSEDQARSMIKTMTRIKQIVSTSDHSTSIRLKKWLETDSVLNIFEIILSSINIMAAKITENRMKIDSPDLIIQPLLGDIHFLAFDQSEKIIKIGYESTKQALSGIDPLTLQTTASIPRQIGAD